MNILIFSLGPIFKTHVHGGSQKVLRDLAVGLAARGHKVNVICTKRRDNYEPFYLDDNVYVEPILPLKEVFPSPYFTSPHNITKTVQLINDRLTLNDVFYIHDSGLNIEFLKNKIPTVISLRDFYYPETLIGGINFNESTIVVNSDYTYDCLMDSFAIIKPQLRERTAKIYNGFNTEFFIRKEPSSELIKLLNVRQEDINKRFIGFPHRPDDSKGIYESLTILEQLITLYSDVKLLIPEYLDDALSASNRVHTASIKKFIESKGLNNNVVFHKWIPHHLMPEYYSICKLILCIGDFLEAFSNVTIEAMLCGTPVISTDSVTYKSMPIQEYLLKYPRGRFDLITEAAIGILSNKIEPVKNARKYLISTFSMNKFITEYEKILAAATVKEPINIVSDYNAVINESSHLRLTAWCHCSNGNIYNEYSKEVYSSLSCESLFDSNLVTFDVKTLLEKGFTVDDVQRAVDDGILIHS